MLNSSDHSIERICLRFSTDGTLASYETHGNGNVNDTFLVACQNGEEINRYTLQRINPDVFENPKGLMDNFSRVTAHLFQKSLEGNHGLQVLTLVPTVDGMSYLIDGGSYWRMTRFIAGGRSFEVPENDHHAYQAAKAFGRFQSDLNDLPGPALVETIPDFHNTRKRLEDFLSSVKKDSCERVAEVEDLIAFAKAKAFLAEKITLSEFPSRVVHNDTKLNNVLLHKDTGEGMCVLDLDTVMPGCVLHDFGDLVRTAACSSLEDETNLDQVHFLPAVFEAIVEGYLESAGAMLVQKEIEFLPMAPLVITYELGLRFLTDYLQGDRYFKVKKTGHNLDRTRAQFKLLSSMEESLPLMESIIERVVSARNIARAGSI